MFGGSQDVNTTDELADGVFLGGVGFVPVIEDVSELTETYSKVYIKVNNLSV